MTIDQLLALCTILGILAAAEGVRMAFLRSRKPEESDISPATEVDITEYDELPPGVAVTLAWFETGDIPIEHYAKQDAVREQMPTLARALDRMHDDF